MIDGVYSIPAAAFHTWEGTLRFCRLELHALVIALFLALFFLRDRNKAAGLGDILLG